MRKNKKTLERDLDSMTAEEKSSYAFSNKIKKLLHRRCMTQAELAQKVGITQTAMSHYINCKRTPSYKTAAKIADVLCTSITYLLNEKCSSETDAEELDANEMFDKDYDTIISLISKQSRYMKKQQKMEIISALMCADDDVL